MTEFAVMPEGTKILPGDRVTVVITVPDAGVLRVEARDGDIRVIERRVPEVVLPTVPGYYLLGFPDGAEAMWVLRNGVWTESGDPLVDDLIENIKDGASLTRLVPEAAQAKLAGRVSLSRLDRRLKAMHVDMSRTWREDAIDLIAAIDSGELDK